jgi:hypothetical protein
VEVPEVPKVMLVGDRVQLRPVLGETEENRLTVPVKPLCAATVIVEVPASPARTVRVVGLAVTVYGVPELTLTVALVVSPPPVPVTVTVKVPGVDEVQDRVDTPVAVPLLNVTLVGETVHDRPADGELDAVRLTAPANPLRPVTVMAEFPVPPEGKSTVAGLAVTVKSWTV